MAQSGCRVVNVADAEQALWDREVARCEVDLHPVVDGGAARHLPS